MDAKTQPSEIYITEPCNALNQKQNNSNDVDEDTTQGRDDIVATKLLHIITTIEATKFELPTQYFKREILFLC